MMMMTLNKVVPAASTASPSFSQAHSQVQQRLQMTPVQSRKASGSFSTASSSAASNNSFSTTPPTQKPLVAKHANQNQLMQQQQLLSDFPFDISSRHHNQQQQQQQQRFPVEDFQASFGVESDKFYSSGCSSNNTIFTQMQEHNNKWHLLNSENSIACDDFESQSPSSNSYPRSTCSSPGKRGSTLRNTGDVNRNNNSNTINSNQQSPLLNCQVIHRLEMPGGKINKLKLPLLAKGGQADLLPAFSKRISEEKKNTEHSPLNQYLHQSPQQVQYSQQQQQQQQQHQQHLIPQYQHQYSTNESKNISFKKVFKVAKQNTASPRISVTPAHPNSRNTTPRGSGISSCNFAPYVSPFQMNAAPLDHMKKPRKLSGSNATTATSTPGIHCYSFNKERVLLFIRLKFQQIDILQSQILSKQEILDFFEAKTIANTYIELHGFREEEAILREFSSQFMRDVFVAVTERSGLVNAREFKNLMYRYFDSEAASPAVSGCAYEENANHTNLGIGSQQQFPVRSFGDVLNLYQVEQRNDIKKPTTSEQVKKKRRQLKSAHIQRENCKATGGFDENPIKYTQLDEIDPNEFRLINIKANQRQEKSCGNEQMQFAGKPFTPEILPGRNSQSPPRIRAVIPRLRSFSIRSDEKNARLQQMPIYPHSTKQSARNLPTNSLKKQHEIGVALNARTHTAAIESNQQIIDYFSSKQSRDMKVKTQQQHHFNQECQSEPVLEFKIEDESEQQQEKAVTSTQLDLFECTFQPHNFQEQNLNLFSQNALDSSSNAQQNSISNEVNEAHFLQTFNMNFRSNSYEVPSVTQRDELTEEPENMTQSEGKPNKNEDIQLLVKKITSNNNNNNNTAIKQMKNNCAAPFLQLELGDSPIRSRKGTIDKNQPSTISPSKYGGNPVDAIDQNCSNFLLKKEVKVFKRQALKKRQTLNEQALDNRSEMPAFETPVRQELVRKLEKLFVCETPNDLTKPAISVLGYDVLQ